MSVAARTAHTVAEERPEEKAGFAKVIEILALLNRVAERAKATPSSIMLQVIKYGKTFKRVIEEVEVDYSAFEKAYRDFTSRVRSGQGSVIRLLKTSYRHGWTEKASVPPSDLEAIVEPLHKLGIADFTFKDELKVNTFFSEAVETYIKQEKVSGVSLYNDADNSLTLYSRVRGATGVGDYYVLLRFEPTGSNKVDVIFFCTCPWAQGVTTDRRGRKIDPEYTSMCKHGIATLFYFFPEILAHLKIAKEGRLSKGEFISTLEKTREAFKEFEKRLDEYVARHPENVEAVFSNTAYLMWREFFNEFSKLGEMKKVVVSTSLLPLLDEMWRNLSIKKRVKEVGEAGEQVAVSTNEVLRVMKEIEKAGIYDKLESLKELLNGLQGSKVTTLYTKALLASLILGSDLESDPVIVSVVGSPGTGKTLTATGLGRLVGTTTLVVEREVSREELIEEASELLSEKMSRYLEVFRKIVEPKLPPERRGEAEKFFTEASKSLVDVAVKGTGKEVAKLVKEFAGAFAALYGLQDDKAAKAVAKLLYSVAKVQREAYKRFLTTRALKRKALEVRRELLRSLGELGLLSNPDEKENVNAGAVRWEALETLKGYTVRIYVDLHYLVSRFGGSAEKVAEVLQKVSRLGKAYVKQETPGIAELKLSTAEDLEKALRVREEDLVSPAKRLIWVGGEVTKKVAVLIDESRRAPELLERLLTDLSTAARDFRRTNIVITTDNVAPLMEAESDPRLDAFHSRVNFEVATPDPSVAYIVNETLKKILELEREHKVPLITLDELLLLNYVARSVHVPEKYEKIVYSLPLVLVYDFKVLRPEVVVSTPGDRAKDLDPMVLLVPKGLLDVGEVKGDYQECSWGRKVPQIRLMSERRLGHHVLRASKALSVVDKKAEVDEETFLSALEAVVMSRIIPVGVHPLHYLMAKREAVSTIIDKVKEFLSKKETATERLIELLGSMSPISASDTS